ncbi:MAG: helix-turn-helix domain-containing protein [Nostoc sp. NMS7]|uniref:helix-turn-helix domain-containing protein n=1 Tax=Nostoc sp. NMS7 TaxID=2815391 RepID=UPI0025ECDCEA|nr:helix-turn-helix transcriptional regulator [Nostoc sp. NMS7]MBN3948382.1 helix-turn-helix domain-containing protein [Nostoc sp. NMS7]
MDDGIWLTIVTLQMDDLAKQRLIDLLVRVQGDRSQREFARDLEITPGALQNWLLGRVPSSDNLQKIATAAGMTIEQLFSELKGESSVYVPKVAEDVLQIALQLNNEQRRRLIKLLIDTI